MAGADSPPDFPLTELHRHLDVSVRLSTLLELAKERGFVGQSTSLEGFRRDFVLHDPMKDLGAVLAKFTLYQQVLDRPEVPALLDQESWRSRAPHKTMRVELLAGPSSSGQPLGLEVSGHF